MGTLFVASNDLFFKNFSYLKEKFSLSRKALSRLLGVSIYMIEDIEKNQCNYDLPLALIARASQIFGVDMDELISADLTKDQ